MSEISETKLMEVLIVRYESKDPLTETKYSHQSETIMIDASSPKHAVMQAIKRTSLDMMGAHVHCFVDGQRVYFD